MCPQVWSTLFFLPKHLLPTLPGTFWTMGVAPYGKSWDCTPPPPPVGCTHGGLCSQPPAHAVPSACNSGVFFILEALTSDATPSGKPSLIPPDKARSYVVLSCDFWDHHRCWGSDLPEVALLHQGRALGAGLIVKIRCSGVSHLICMRFSSMLHGLLGVTGMGIPCCCG